MDAWLGFLLYEICVLIGLVLLLPYYEWSMRRAFRIPDDKIWMYSGMTIKDFVAEVELKIEQGHIDKGYFEFIELK